MLKYRICILAFLFLAVTAFAQAPVVLISIDGMRPDYITNPKACPSAFPTIQRFLKEGTYAEGVTGVLPTSTYPSHTTLVTGVEPARHGIWGNVKFDPESTNQSGWYWYAEDIKTDTLWDAAARNGLITASVGWPVSVGQRNIRFNIPEYWRARNTEDRKLLRALSTPELYDAIEKQLRSIPGFAGPSLELDAIYAEAAIYSITHEHARFVTLHLSSLDHAEHEHGPFSPQACESLVELDKQVALVQQAAIATNSDAVIAVVSDHGFARTDYRVNLMVPLIKAGLLKLGPHASEWKAAVFPTGGTAAIVLHDPNDKATEEAVRALLHQLAGNPANGIAAILEKAEIEKFGGFPNAAFVVDLQTNYQLGYAAEGELVTPAPSTGSHGYLPSHPEMRASFFVRGRGIAAGRDLGIIDMRQIAPTLAEILGVTLKDAQQPKLNIRVAPVTAVREECLPASRASELIGKHGCVAGRVFRVTTPKNGSTHISLCPPRSNCSFHAVVLQRDHDNLGDLSYLHGKVVAFVGDITMYRDHPEIVVTNRQQVRVMAGDTPTQFDVDQSRPASVGQSPGGITRSRAW